ncbi:hypothetical protein [Pedobacter frigoris]|uniref:hypothetical protein n=1 Tax=Pedobacter frigoris TaxID=2571272 RepID=UPI002931C56F|nr:hypothetical protein [Pedobacter frigoris]
MKQRAKIILFSVFGLYFKRKFRKLIKGVSKCSRIYLVDIDNTLAHTWPSLKDYVYRGENHRYRSLSIFLGMRKFIIEKIRNDEKIIFISARSYFNFRTTRDWLKSNGLPGDQVILVANPDDKLEYISELLYRGINVVYIDDLSHSHEYGSVKLYGELILDVKELPIEYLGIDEIELINSTYEGNNKST